jgi:hypothetical protein
MDVTVCYFPLVINGLRSFEIKNSYNDEGRFANYDVDAIFATEIKTSSSGPLSLYG